MQQLFDVHGSYVPVELFFEEFQANLNRVEDLYVKWCSLCIKTYYLGLLHIKQNMRCFKAPLWPFELRNYRAVPALSFLFTYTCSMGQLLQCNNCRIVLINGNCGKWISRSTGNNAVLRHGNVCSLIVEYRWNTSASRQTSTLHFTLFTNWNKGIPTRKPDSYNMRNFSWRF